MRVNLKGYKDLVTLTGSLLDVPVGSVLLCESDWRVEARYGQQFVVQSWTEVMPATIYGIEKYLGSGLVKGIGPVFAKSIVSKFGTETLNVIDNEPDRLLEVPKLGKKRVERIKELGEAEQEQLVETATKLLEAEEVSVREAIASMIETKDLIEDSEVVYLPPFYYAEDGSAKRLSALLSSIDSNDYSIAAEPEMEYGGKPSGIIYDDVQQDAIQKALNSNVMVLTGGPSTGKTTITQGIIEAFKARKKTILLAAPTGRAFLPPH